jgi:hypothetical protein
MTDRDARARLTGLTASGTRKAAATAALALAAALAATPFPHPAEAARGGGEQIIRALGAQPSWLNLRAASPAEATVSESHPTSTRPAGASRALSLASADFDEDGVPDLLSGHAGGGGGLVSARRGNPDAIYSHSPEARERRARRQFTDAPFFPVSHAASLPDAPDFLAAGDFDADGHRDAAAARLGGDALFLLRGDGRGAFSEAERVALPGVVTALAAGDVNRRDGLIDLLVATDGEGGPRLHVFEHANGALRSGPESFALPAAATSVAVGQLDEGAEIDFVAAAGDQLIVVQGRDRRTSLDAEGRAQVPGALISRVNFETPVLSVSVGDFAGGHRQEIAALTAGGELRLLQRLAETTGVGATETTGANESEATGEGTPAAPLFAEAAASLPLPAAATVSPNAPRSLMRAKVSALPKDDLVVLDGAAGQLHLVTQAAAAAPGGSEAEAADGRAAGLLLAASFDASGGASAVLPMRLNEAALDSLLVLGGGRSAPFVLQPLAGALITVNTTADNNVRDGVLTLDEAIRVANGSLAASTLTAAEQAQISGTPSNPGLDNIHFNIPTAGVPTITVVGTLPTVSDAVVVDGTTQPGAGRVEVNSPDSGVTHNFLITAGASAVRGMVLNGASSGIELQTGGNNVVEGNFFGTNTDGTAAAISPNGNQVFIDNSPNNTVGGTTPAARNVLSAGTAFAGNGVDIRGAASTGNVVAGNYIGTNAAGTAAIGNRDDGVFLLSAPNNTIGGTTAGAGNVIAGLNSTSGAGIRINSGCAGTLIQGNLIGLDKDGAAALTNRGYGIRVGSGITVGGTTPAARNVVSGGGRDGIYFGAAGIVVQGNYVGTNAAGTSAVPNSEHGVNMTTHSNNTVGGALAGARNVISGNIGDGVNLADTFGGNPDGNRVQGNYIGTDATGTLAVPNQGDGIDISDTDNTLVGGATTEARNLISGNRLNGVEVTPANDGYLKPARIEGNYIGTNAFGTGALGNGAHGIHFTNNGNGMTVGGTAAGAGNVIAFNGGDGVSSSGSASAFVVLGNSIFLNDGLGFDRGDNGPDANGTTLTRNAPALTSATARGSVTTVSGTLQQNHSTAVSYTVQFFSNDACDPSGSGEGRTFVGQTTVQITNNGPVNFTADISPAVAGGSFVTALAVGQSTTTAGLLTASEFSACVQATGPTPTPTPTPLSLFAVAPGRGGNTGSVTSRVTGQGFHPNARVALRRVGAADNFGGLVRVDAGGGSLTATFDLTGALPGAYDVVVINPDNSATTLPAAFTVEAGGGADVWADLMGRARNRVNSNSRFYIMVGNRGNTDAYHVPVFLSGLPNDATVRVEFDVLTPPSIPNAEPVDYSAIPIVSGNETGRLIPVVVPRLRPGQVVALPVIVRLPAAGEITLSVRASRPMVSSLSFAPSPKGGAAVPHFDIDSLDPDLVNCLAAIIKFAATEVLGTLLGDSCVDLVKQILLNELPNFLGNAVSLAAADDGFGEGFSFAQIFTQLLQIGLKSALCAANIVLPQARIVALALKLADIAALIQSGVEICDACFNNFCSDLIKKIPLIFVASNDPNDKTGARGNGADHYVQSKAPIPYSIFFENLPTATAPAQDVFITDQLDASKLDLNTFRFGNVFFGNTQVAVPEVSDAFVTEKDLRPARDLIVRVSGELDKTTGLLRWTFTSLDPATGLPVTDPDAGFLPPNVNSPEGDGAVLFAVSPRPGLATGDQIRNSARIVFDQNAPIDTPVWLNTIDDSRPASSVAPLAAAQTSSDFEVRWSGTDAGAGVQSYTIYVSENGGPFRKWLTGTTATSALFAGRAGRTYAFYSLAKDNAGNEEAVPASPDATTTTTGISVQFNAAAYTFPESDAAQGARLVVTRTGDTSGTTSVNYRTLDDPSAVRCDERVSVSFARCDYATTLDTLTFAPGEAQKTIAVPLIDDGHPENSETFRILLSSPTGGGLGEPSQAVVTLTDNDAAGAANPLDSHPFFVRQQYLDFLSREPEQAGFDAWLGVLSNCPNPFNTDPASPSAACDRVTVSSSFFRSPEFQLKGFYALLFYRAAFGRLPEYSEIAADMRAVTGQTGAEVFQKRAAYADSFARRPEFAARYGGVTNRQFVDELLNRYQAQQITTEDPADAEGAAQVTLTRRQLAAQLDSGALTRAQVLRAVVQSNEVDAAEFNGAFVAMQYYGYLRRKPEAAGFEAWLAYLNRSPQDFRTMVNGFVNSQEYRLRFGPT